MALLLAQVADGLTYLKFRRDFSQTTNFNNLYPLRHCNNFHWEKLAHTKPLSIKWIDGIITVRAWSSTLK